MQGDSKPSRMYLPEVDTDDAVNIWCGQTQKPLTPGRTLPPSAWMVAEQEEESEDYTSTDTSESSTETSSSSTGTISSSMLRRWRRIRSCYADNPDVRGEVCVYRVLTYMGHPHWRKVVNSESSTLKTVLQATMALRLEDLRQKRLQMEGAWSTLLKKTHASDGIIQYKERAIKKLEKELKSLCLANSSLKQD
ncbi:uncharacterized protein LOC135367335 [Ornithodoros turicata]|uniref:uncharacterized protein LOC135367335 n=1 Tax=Ornithodoros turicata TaxID=34597 RepID=UPI00313A348A